MEQAVELYTTALTKFQTLKEDFDKKTSNKNESILDTIDPDVRLDKCMKRLGFSEKEIRIIYGIYDSISYRSPPPENHQYITTDDFFKKLLKSNRTAFGDAILNLIEIKNPETLSFGEYVDCICAFCLFEEDDVLKLAFKMFDPEKSGFVDKDELRFFIYSQHDDDQGSNIERGLKYLEDNDDGDGRFEFYQIVDMHKYFQQLFYPCFDLQIAMKRKSGLGERWWELKKYQLIDERHQKSREEEAKTKAKNKNEAMASELETERLVQERMGFKYYAMFWQRGKVRQQIQRIAAINEELGDSSDDEEKAEDD